jgi:hypothetical protein
VKRLAYSIRIGRIYKLECLIKFGRKEFQSFQIKPDSGVSSLDKSIRADEKYKQGGKNHIGGYQPAQKWLKDRKGRTLSVDDIMHHQRIIVALTNTDSIMKEIDEINFLPKA